jgi:3'-5' exoribonuclease
MKSVYVSDLRPNQDVTTAFLVKSKEVRLKKTGDPYLSLSLCDRTGDIEAKMWDNVAEIVSTFDRDDFIKVKGRVQVYQNRQQFTVHRMLRLSDDEVDFADYFPASERDPDEMFTELRGIIAGVKDEHIRALLDALMDDPEIGPKFKRAPAAKSVHHAFLGGLLEHVLSLCTLCRATAAHYPFVDHDLLVAGAVLHDIGKIEELSYRRSFGYTDDGQLLGHIVIGLRMIDEKLRGMPDFPPRLRTLIEHIVVSHHGLLEFGSPKVPVFPEALLFHFLDNLDSKMENMRSVLERDKQIEGFWTSHSPPLERSLLKKEAYISGESAPQEPSPATPPPAAQPPGAGKRNPQQTLFAEKLKDALKPE